MARKKIVESMEDVAPEQLEIFINFLRDYPSLASEILLNLPLAPHERLAIDGMWNARWVLNVWGRGTGKCQVGSDRLLLSDGSYEELQYLVGKDIELLALDDKTFKLTPAKGRVSYNGEKRCLFIKTRSGRELTVTENHPLLKIDGWYSANELNIGDRIATTREYNLNKQCDNISEVEAKLLGYLVGDGGLTGYSVCFTNANKKILDDYVTLIGKFDKDIRLRTAINSHPSNKSSTLVASNAKSLKQFSEEHKINCLAKVKRIPKSIFKSSNEIVTLFLNRYFACDGYTQKCSVSICSASKGLMQDTQHLLLRFGVLSKVSYSPSKLNGKVFDAWTLDITGKDNIIKFIKQIDIFGKEEKTTELYDDVITKISNPNTDTIPKDIWKIAKENYGCQIKSRKHQRCWSNYYSPSREKFKRFAEDFKVEDFKRLAESDIFWDEIVEIKKVGAHKTYAVEVPKYMNYVSNDVINHNTFLDGVYAVLRCLLYPNEKVVIVGPSFRQSILVFNEAEKLINRTEFVKQSLDDKPKHHANEYRMKFRNGSMITALPLGTDGSKIRGVRATVIIVDEAAQVPSEIIDMAVIPFMATYKDPMAKYLGVETDSIRNTLVFSSSAYYQFNHLFEKYLYWLKQMQLGNQDYFMTKFNYFDTPEGFIDLDVVAMQKKTSTEIIFRMEYLAEFPRDSLGFFPASLLQKCLTRFVSPLEKGRKGYKYVMGLDPARTEDFFGIVILELEGEYRNVVRVEAHKGKTLPVMKDHIVSLMERFDIVRVGCDAYGGGRALADLLADANGYTVVNPRTGILEQRQPIIVVGDKEQRDRLPHGREILDLVIFSAPSIAEMNYALKAKMEDGLLRLPATPFHVSAEAKFDEDAEDVYSNVMEMMRELENVSVEAQQKSGYLRFTVPENMHDDRYSALFIANKAADNFTYVPSQIHLPTGFWVPTQIF